MSPTDTPVKSELAKERDRYYQTLTTTEKITLAMLLKGMTTTEMAVELVVSKAAVHAQVQALYRKLGHLISSHTRLKLVKLFSTV